MVYPSAQVVAESDMVRYHRVKLLYVFINVEKITIDIMPTYSI